MNGQTVLNFNQKKGYERMHNEGNAARKNREPVIEFCTREEAIRDHYNSLDAEAKWRRKEKARNRENKIKYFFRQRMMGLGVVAMGAGVIASTKIIETPMLNYLGLMIGVLGLYIFMTKNMVLIDRYYFECQDRLNEC